MTLAAQYAADVAAETIQSDPGQLQQIVHLDVLLKQVIEWHQQKNRFWRLKAINAPLGWYCYGGVGIGKTYLMDLFFEALHHTQVQKKRQHFHDFMRTIHAELTALQGQRDPLLQIAKRICKECDVLCFDEFMVHDIADAMLLGELFKHLFAQGLVLLATSNCAPDELYYNGLQRQQFLPAIALLKKQCHVAHLQSNCDYRMQQLLERGIYFHPLTPATYQSMQDCFMHMTSQRGELNQSITIFDRDISVLGLGSEVIWFDFNVICGLGRSQHDYLIIAENYHTVLLSHIPQLEENDTDRVILFMYLIDVLYDAKVKVILQAACPLDELYLAGRKKKEFSRTESRLHEMQTSQYLHSIVSK